MASSNQKRIDKRPEKEQVTLSDTLHDTWTVMKPFVHFSIKALRVIGYALIFIVKSIPKLEGNKPAASKKNKIIKI
jgi:hypothetical protein